MKIHCSCGAILHDHTDALPHAGHFIPDQRWFPLFDALDEQVVDALLAGEIGREAAYHRLRTLLSRASRAIYQCPSCGRLYLDDPKGTLHAYVPAHPDAPKDILRGS